MNREAPFNNEAEQSVLGSMILDNDLILLLLKELNLTTSIKFLIEKFLMLFLI